MILLKVNFKVAENKREIENEKLEKLEKSVQTLLHKTQEMVYLVEELINEVVAQRKEENEKQNK